MNELHLFAGIGGGILGGMLLGHTCVCAVELEPYRRQALLQRQRDGILPRFPIWDDVRTFDGQPWRGLVDIVCGGFPCQDISTAGTGEGITGSRSGLWKEMWRIIRDVAPSIVFVENSPVLTSRGLGVVLGDLATLGYDAKWGVVSVADAIWIGGTPCLDHLRYRIWIVATHHSMRGRYRHEKDALRSGRNCIEPSGGTIANTNSAGRSRSGQAQSTERIGDSELARGMPEITDTNEVRRELRRPEREGIQRPDTPCDEADSRNSTTARFRTTPNPWWGAEPGMDRVVHGFPNRVDRVSSIGDSQVPAVARLAFKMLSA